MPDYVPISDLTLVNSIGDNDLFPMSDGSGAYAVKGRTIKSYAASDAVAAAADAALSKTAAQNAATDAGLAQDAAEAAQAAAEEAVGDAEEAIDAFTEKLTLEDDGKSATLLEMTDGVIYTNGSTIGEPLPTATTFKYVKAACVPGEKFTVNGTGGNNSRLFAFADSSGNVLDRSPAGITVEDFVVIAPTDAAWIVINDNSGSASFRGESSRARNRTKWQATAVTKLLVSDERQESPVRVPVLRESTENISYLVDIEPGKSYRITKSASSARLVLGGINNLIVGTGDSRRIGKIFYRNPSRTVAEFDNTTYKYLLVQVATSTEPTMPDITVEVIPSGSVRASLPAFTMPLTAAEYHQLWEDNIVTNGGKYGDYSVCYRELLTTVHNLPVYAYFISFDTQRMKMASNYAYSIINTVDGEIPYGDYANGYTKRKVTLISGMHGDEKAGPLGLFQWVYNLCYNPDYVRYHCYDYYIVPLSNPTGYNADTRNNADGININRDAIAQESAEAQAIAAFIAEQTTDIFIDFHQARLPWESTSIPYYGFVSLADNTEASVARAVKQSIFRAGEKSDEIINDFMLDADKPQGTFLWDAYPTSGTFKAYASDYADASMTLETSQRCPYYTGTTDTEYEFTALVCNQTYIDCVMSELMAYLHE